MSEVRYTLSGSGCGCVTVGYGTKERFVRAAKALRMKAPDFLRLVTSSVSEGENIQLTERDIVLFLNRVESGQQVLPMH